MSVICFDTHILIWGIKEQASKTQTDMIQKAKKFIESLDENKTSVIIPSVVLAEYLIPIPQIDHAAIVSSLLKNFMVVPFDALTASKFALIWQTNISPEGARKAKENNLTRAEMKADLMIIASAVSRNADCIYSHDPGIQTFAKGFIDVREIPLIPETADMFKGKVDENWGDIPKEGLMPED